MFYNHARFILTMLGIVIGMTGYYLEIYCQVGYERILWIGSTLAFAAGGFIIGGLIEHFKYLFSYRLFDRLMEPEIFLFKAV